MSRFSLEISGKLGQYWLDSATKEVEECVNKANKDAIVESNGAIRWKLSGNYLMDDFCEKLEYANYNFSRQATAEMRDAQNSEYIKEYKKNFKGYSQEELSEMRNAFGEGTIIVDVLSGNQITL